MAYNFPITSTSNFQGWNEPLTFSPGLSLPIRQPEPPMQQMYQQTSPVVSTGSLCRRRDSMVGLASVAESSRSYTTAGSESNSSRSPLANFSFFKNIDKKTTRDGQPAKRRGPKPDSKPALTRRQELNRQAQRTHRERKEQYIKALEQEVIRIRDTMTNSIRERDAVMEENRRLRELLAAHGIHVDVKSPGGYGSQSGYTTAGSGASVSTGYNPMSASTGYTSPPRFPPSSSAGGIPPQQSPNQHFNGHVGGVNYDEIGIDFVLTLERPCMDHMQMLLVRSATGADEDISGHALMASCPPDSHIQEKPSEPYPLQMPEGVAMPDLMKLLDLSNRLPLDGEITPIMAWAIILRSERLKEFSKEDFLKIKEELLAKVHCYGFGAVLEEFEVQDALSNVLVNKPGGGGGGTDSDSL